MKVDVGTVLFISMLNQIADALHFNSDKPFVPIFGGLSNHITVQDSIFCLVGQHIFYDNRRLAYEDNAFRYFPLVKGIYKDDKLVYYPNAFVGLAKKSEDDNCVFVFPNDNFNFMQDDAVVVTSEGWFISED